MRRRPARERRCYTTSRPRSAPAREERTRMVRGWKRDDGWRYPNLGRDGPEAASPTRRAPDGDQRARGVCDQRHERRKRDGGADLRMPDSEARVQQATHPRGAEQGNEHRAEMVRHPKRIAKIQLASQRRTHPRAARPSGRLTPGYPLRARSTSCSRGRDLHRPQAPREGPRRSALRLPALAPASSRSPADPRPRNP